MWEIDFLWQRFWLVLSGAALIAVLHWLTCRRRPNRHDPKHIREVSCHHTHRGPAL
jgi:hypothetical protein